MRIKKALVVFLFSLSFLIVSESFAKVNCTGVPKEVKIWGDEMAWVAVSLRYKPGPFLVCSMNKVHGNKTPEQCKGMYSMLLGAALTSRQVSLNYSNLNDCSEVPVASGAAIKELDILTIH